MSAADEAREQALADEALAIRNAFMGFWGAHSSAQISAVGVDPKMPETPLLDRWHPRGVSSGAVQPARPADEQVRAVQGWMALDLHMALGGEPDMRSEVENQGYPSWADWWAELCGEVRALSTRQAAGEVETPRLITDAQVEAAAREIDHRAFDLTCHRYEIETDNRWDGAQEFARESARTLARKVLEAARG